MFCTSNLDSNIKTYYRVPILNTRSQFCWTYENWVKHTGTRGVKITSLIKSQYFTLNPCRSRVEPVPLHRWRLYYSHESVSIPRPAMSGRERESNKKCNWNAAREDFFTLDFGVKHDVEKNKNNNTRGAWQKRTQ